MNNKLTKQEKKAIDMLNTLNNKIEKLHNEWMLITQKDKLKTYELIDDIAFDISVPLVNIKIAISYKIKEINKGKKDE